MVDIDATETLSDAEQAEVRAMHDAAAAADGYASLGDAVRVGIEPGNHEVAVRNFVARGDDGRVVGYGALAPADNAERPHSAAGIVVHPEHRKDGVQRDLLQTVTLDVARRGGGPVVWWRVGADERSDADAAAAGYSPTRDLLQMVVPLPLSEPARWPEGVDVRAFVPGRDDAEWLRVNNRAFEGHPEQGGWVQSTLDRRMHEPWFDPKGFLLAFDRDGLAGFCWTKIHEDDGLGEIYVIGVDPSRAGRHLGRPLVVAGLQSIAERGVPTGMLFVDAANERAVRLYESLGFTTRRTDRAYQNELGAP
ncbi:MAG: mycothiol synthase [Actinobacteria bacterium]|nr:mycothiol synthase [Actinomycetota bacterium]